MSTIALAVFLLSVHPAMGFDLDKAAHHFLLTQTGGIIHVEPKDRGDKPTSAQIRMHLRHIASAFATGDFGAPFATHGEVPPGVPAMQRLKDSISYSFEDTKQGARVIITSHNHEAIDAIHEFLRYQIREHKTGDPL